MGGRWLDPSKANLSKALKDSELQLKMEPSIFDGFFY